MITIRNVLITAGALALVVFIGVIDTATGLIPDITILYLVPIVTATVLVGLQYGSFIAVIAAIVELFSNIQVGVGLGITLFLDAGMHFLVFILSAILVDRLLGQLKRVTALEQRRSYDLSIAKGVLESVFTPFPAEYKDLSLGVKIAFSRELGGDYYHFADIDGKLFFCIGDIAGKSVSAALFSALLHRDITNALEDLDTLTAIVRQVNARMHESLPENIFVTLFCARINSGTITFINAGHEPPLLYSKQDKSVRLLETLGTLPLGIAPDLEVKQISIPFTPGDILLAVTDGITESAGFRDNPSEKLESLLRENANANPQDITETIFKNAMPNNTGPPSDDIIVACVKRER